MHKKGNVAGTWVIGLVIYFVLFFIVMAQAVQIDDSLSQSGTDFTNSISTIEQCITPREQLQTDIRGVGHERDSFCYATMGFNDEVICESLSGCSWQNETTGFWFWEQSTNIKYCSGEINWETYNTTKGDVIGEYGSVCNVPAFSDNKYTCLAMGCSWGIPTAKTPNAFSIIGFILDLMTFNVNIGLTGAGLGIFLLIFFYIPAIILTLAIVLLVAEFF